MTTPSVENQATLKDVGDSMNSWFKGAEDAFKHMGARPGGWWGSQQSGKTASASSTTPATRTGRQNGSAGAGNTQESFRHVGNASNSTAARTAQSPDDITMRRHCAALERLVEIGLSPQASKVALRHLDSWLVSEECEIECSTAEVVAESMGEPVLHVKDKVKLEGLVKNVAVNGMVGSLVAYGAADQRWKVQLSDGQMFWVRPKLLKPLEPRTQQRGQTPTAGSPTNTDAETREEDVMTKRSSASSHTSGQQQLPAPAAQALADGWAILESKKMAWNEEQEARELVLLEKEEMIRKMQDALEAEREVLGEQREMLERQREQRQREQREMLEQTCIEARSVKSEPQNTDRKEPKEFHMSRNCVDDEEDEECLVRRRMTASSFNSTVGELNEDDETDEMWDMDWSTVGGSAAGRACSSSATTPDKSSGAHLERANAAGDMPDEAAVTAGPVCPQPRRPAEESTINPLFGGVWAPSASSKVAPVKKAKAETLRPQSEIPSWTAKLSAAYDSPRERPRSPGLPPALPTPEKAELFKKLEEKRLLAEKHNGQDLTINNRVEFNKGRMPGVHPDIAQKLEERRRKLEAEENSTSTPPVEA